MTRTFNVTGFTIPVAIVYSAAPDVQVRVPGIASSEAGAEGFVERLVMQTVFDILERQARSALLPDGVISTILDQLNAQIRCTPMNCQKVVNADNMNTKMKEQYCIIVGNTMTGFCDVMVANRKCLTTVMDMVTVTRFPDVHLTFSGTLLTSNIIMANWSRTMWQNAVNRALRILASGPFGSHFFSAIAIVGGN
ncbi:hypothetical protein KIN20_001234 [Parelaphostrongylus tenuis]|uniref:Uncharacterized protein n=1 Tax=Parelaphostrongylus tenuis TaxID=148309 RepID=A0AAD5QC38_PARTN|nr:hypothetical protein KIN20_001234 [Parelaphostrongylus tenuis]